MSAAHVQDGQNQSLTTIDEITVHGISIREFDAADGRSLRELWEDSGFGIRTDDDAGLVRFSDRNKATFLVAEHRGRVIASALGGWDGRRGWLYHVTTHPSYRRKGIAQRLVGLIEVRLRQLGCVKINLLVVPENDLARAFWARRGYVPTPLVEYTKELTKGGPAVSTEDADCLD